MLKKRRGFSLIELLVSLSIIGIILSTAVPNFIDFINRAKSGSVTEDIYFDLQTARTLAISSGISTDFKMGSSIGVKNWSIAQNGEILKTMPVKTGDFMFISSIGWLSDFEITFSPEGFIKKSDGAVLGGVTLWACDRAIGEGKTYELNAIGKIKMTENTC